MVILMVDMMIHICPFEEGDDSSQKQNEVDVIGCLKLPMRLNLLVKP